MGAFVGKTRKTSVLPSFYRIEWGCGSDGMPSVIWCIFYLTKIFIDALAMPL